MSRAETHSEAKGQREVSGPLFGIKDSGNSGGRRWVGIVSAKYFAMIFFAGFLDSNVVVSMFLTCCGSGRWLRVVVSSRPNSSFVVAGI